MSPWPLIECPFDPVHRSNLLKYNLFKSFLVVFVVYTRNITQCIIYSLVKALNQLIHVAISNLLEFSNNCYRLFIIASFINLTSD